MENLIIAVQLHGMDGKVAIQMTAQLRLIFLLAHLPAFHSYQVTHVFCASFLFWLALNLLLLLLLILKERQFAVWRT